MSWIVWFNLIPIGLGCYFLWRLRKESKRFKHEVRILRKIARVMERLRFRVISEKEAIAQLIMIKEYMSDDLIEKTDINAIIKVIRQRI